MEPYTVESDDELNEDAESNVTVFIPQVQKDIVPFMNQQFNSLDDVRSFYNTYAKACGFGVRSNSVVKDKTGVIRRKVYTCYKVDRPVKLLNPDTKRKRGCVGENCKAKIAVLLRDGKYLVSLFIEEHSHPLSDGHESHLLRSHRSVTDVAKALKKQMDIVNISASKQFELLQVQCGGVENLGFLKRDFYNYTRDLNSVLKGHDGERLFDYMKLQEEKNPSFTFKIESDEKKRITRCFWCDGYSKRIYSTFGDVIVFDTTYQTNRYGLIFAPIVGVNNHGQTIILACAFLSGETFDDFVWLFTNFLEAMSGHAPGMVITDQDLAMTKALPVVMPNTVHRYCVWHIMYKFSSKLDVQKYSPYSHLFSDCIYKSESSEEFEKKWKYVVDKSGLGDNEWLKELFEIRAKWVPAYSNCVFSAGMRSSQRAESGHAFFKNFVSAHNSLVDFMIRFERGLAHQRHEELICEHKDKIEKPKTQIVHPFSDHVKDIYTLEIYRKFEQQLLYSFGYRLELLSDESSKCIYKIQRKKDDSNKEDDSRRIRYIFKDKVDDRVSCTCRMFETEGILCRHVLAYFSRFEDYFSIPEKYILKRWTKSAKIGMSDCAYVGNDTSYLVLRSKMAQLALDVVDKAISHEETRTMFTDSLRVLSESVDNFFNDNKKGKNDSTTQDQTYSAKSACTFESSYREPDLVRYKGCGKRLKGGKELAMKPRRCHGCNQYGHDKRKCPVVINATKYMETNELNTN